MWFFPFVCISVFCTFALIGFLRVVTLFFGGGRG